MKWQPGEIRTSASVTLPLAFVFLKRVRFSFISSSSFLDNPVQPVFNLLSQINSNPSTGLFKFPKRGASSISLNDGRRSVNTSDSKRSFTGVLGPGWSDKGKTHSHVTSNSVINVECYQRRARFSYQHRGRFGYQRRGRFLVFGAF